MSSEYKPRRITAIYFSPTNGTKEVVKNIKKKIEGAKITELDITKKKNREQRETITHSDADLAIVATPVYEGRIPPLVREYLKECAFVNLPVIAVVSYGNVIIGKALRWLVESLTKRGAKVIGFGAF